MKTKTDTRDIYFCAAMLALGAKVDRVDKADPKHMKFYLSQSEPVYTFQSISIPDTSNVVGGSIAMDFEYYEKEWVNETLVINAVKYKDAIQRVKTIIHSD